MGVKLMSTGKIPKSASARPNWPYTLLPQLKSTPSPDITQLKLKDKAHVSYKLLRELNDVCMECCVLHTAKNKRMIKATRNVDNMNSA